MLILHYKKILIVILLALSFTVNAGSQLDLGINIPVLIGLTVDGKNATEEVPYTIPVPDLMYNYFFEFDRFKVGGGFRVWSVLLLTGAYPIISTELDLSPLILNAHIGGAFFLYTGLASGSTTGQVFLPELSATINLTDWFSLGVGILGIYVPEVSDSGMGYSINVIGRFRLKG